jgi:hypothetical protein
MKLDERLVELAERVEKASGPDRELEYRIWCAIQGAAFQSLTIRGDHEYFSCGLEPLKFPDWAVPGHFTASLDAAVSLCERVLPAFGWQITQDVGLYWASVSHHNGPFHKDTKAQAKTPALALLSATLRALTKGQTK